MVLRRDHLKDKILNSLDDEEDGIVDFCSQIIKIPSENPPGITTDIADYLKDFLKAKGLTVDVYEPMKGMPNLIVSIGENEGRSLVLNAHMDEFPGGDWDAFSGKVSDGRIIGRGASDMKGGLTASVFSLIKIHEICEISGRLTLVLVSDEETGGRWGTGWLLNNVPHSVGDACLIGEATGTSVLATGEKGVCWLKFRAWGNPGHGAHGRGEGAIEKMSKVFPIMLDLRKTRGDITQIEEEFSTLLRIEKEDLIEEYGAGAERVLEYATVNIGTIKGGTKVNIVPTSCELELDIRLPFGVKLNNFLAILEKGLDNEELRDIEYELIQGHEGTYTSCRESVIKIVEENVREIVGVKPTRYPIRLGATDSRFYREKNVPTVVYGPKAYNMAAVNEYITADDLITVTKVHAATAYDFLKEER